MTSPVDIRPDHLEIVQGILREHLPVDVKVWVFGSRTNWTTKDSSDLDLALDGESKLSHKLLGALKGAFEDSTLPYTVDVVDLNAVSHAFKQIVKEQRVALPLVRAPGRVDGAWRDVLFSEAVLVNPPTRLDRGAIYPFVDMAAVNADSRTTVSVEERTFKGSGSRFQSGDTLMARITPCLENGKIARYQAVGDKLEAHGSTEFIVIRGRADVTDTNFAYYLTKWEEVRNYAIGQMTGTSGRQRVPVDSLDHLTVPLPPLSEQRAIAHVLGTLDDKIELNRRMNETLEAMARALFKSWFVDFEPVRAKMEGRWRPGESLPGLPAEHYDLFPDRLVDSEMGEIPDGWEVKTLGEVARQRRSGVKPDEIDAESPYIALEHMPKRCIALTQWSNAVGLASGKFKFEQGDILFGKLRPCFHKVGVAPLDGVCSTDIVVVHPTSNLWFGFVLGHTSSAEFVDYTDATSTGTRMPRTNWPDMARYKVALPSIEVSKAFTGLVEPCVNRIVSAIHESHSLAAQRDALLPRLVSGAVGVNGVSRWTST